MGDSIWATLGKILLSFLSNKADGKTEISVDIPIGAPKEEPAVAPESSSPAAGITPVGAIDWTNKDYSITPHFTVGDAVTLHSWNRLATAADGLTDDGKAKLVVLCNKMEEIRTLLGCPISVHCMYRSPEYNAQVVKAIPNDVHAQFLACDFDCSPKLTIEQTHGILEPFLEKYGIRMERNTPTWIHIDLHPVGNARYFNA